MVYSPTLGSQFVAADRCIGNLIVNGGCFYEHGMFDKWSMFIPSVVSLIFCWDEWHYFCDIDINYVLEAEISDV